VSARDDADAAEPGARTRGPIALFARHRNAPNLLLALMAIAGVFGIVKMNSQSLPTFGIDVVNVSVEWPGATAADVDTKLVRAIVPEIRVLDNVKRVRATATEGVASVGIEFEAGSDMQAALSDVEAATSRIRTFPEDAKAPNVKRIARYERILRVVLSGPHTEAALKAHAKRLRDGLLDRGIDRVTVTGARDEEILVEAPSAALRRLDVTLAGVAARIGETSRDLPSGDVGQGRRQIRSLGLVTTARGIEDIEIKALEDGRTIRLGDVARVREGFDEDAVEIRRGGRRAIELLLQRAIHGDALRMARIAEDYLDEVAPTLPETLAMERYDVAVGSLRERIDLLIRNGASGLMIVIVILMVFLRVRVAFWVMAGIPASLLAAFGVMLAAGLTINMVSLFSLIMTIGIIVDDAIVVGEHVDTRSRQGLSPLAAAIDGAHRMAVPVFAAALTTISAFLPLLMISGTLGQIIATIPMVVVAVLIASLMECFLVLPGHLSAARAPSPTGWAARYRRWFDGGFAAFRDGPFRSAVETCIRWRYATLAAAVGLLLLAAGMVAGGRVGFVFFPSPEADRVFANVTMVPGTPRETTMAMLDEMNRALDATVRELEGDDSDLVRMAITKIGVPASGGAAAGFGDNVGGIDVELRPADRRDLRLEPFIDAWRAGVRPIAGLDVLTIYGARGGPPGSDVDVRFIGDDVAALKRAAQELRALLERYPGVRAIRDDLPWGKRETILEVTPRGRSMGFTTRTVGRQVRDAIEGAIATRFPRGDEEVTVRVRLPADERDTDVLDHLHLRGPTGAEVPLDEVVSRRANQGFAYIASEDGRRQVAVTARLDADVVTTGELLAAVERDGLRRIAARHGVEVALKGRSEETRETLADMLLGTVIGLAGIYIVLAWVFASYGRPFAVMAIIPMGFVGTVFGHWLFGYNLTILSLVALMGLSGIVVNNSIILVTTIGRRAEQEPLFEAIVGGVRDRLRAIVLTSVTTIGGLSPLLLETSLQARFLIPMALTIVFGLGCAATLVLFVMPALLAAGQDVRRIRGAFRPLRSLLAPRRA